jgi:hypothetical protein
VIVFTSFYVKEDIPTTITVPCSGTGTMTFAPSPDQQDREDGQAQRDVQEHRWLTGTSLG